MTTLESDSARGPARVVRGKRAKAPRPATGVGPYVIFPGGAVQKLSPLKRVARALGFSIAVRKKPQ